MYFIYFSTSFSKLIINSLTYISVHYPFFFLFIFHEFVNLHSVHSLMEIMQVTVCADSYDFIILLMIHCYFTNSFLIIKYHNIFKKNYY